VADWRDYTAVKEAIERELAAGSASS